jgi:SAM-dependent methyltransferase
VTVFGDYAKFYDLVYEDKAYRREVDFVAGILRGLMPRAGTLLDLGCGTGRHAVHFAEQGFQVCGVDRSGTMLAQAQRRIAELPVALQPGISLVEGDIATVDLQARFDVVVALFHVFSYLADPQALRASLRNVRRHLHKGGLLLFDYWHAPAVLAQLPETRTRRFSESGRTIVRTMRPTLFEDRQCVDIHLHLTVADADGRVLETVDENHLMRYSYPQELRDLLAAEGFEVRTVAAWLSDEPPSDSTWSAYVVAEAV